MSGVILPPSLMTRQGRTTVTAVIRRSFRIGLTLGLLGGVAFAIAKMLGARPHPQGAATPAPTDRWPRLVPEPVAAATTPVAPRTVPDPPAPEPVAVVAAPVEPAVVAASVEPIVAPLAPAATKPPSPAKKAPKKAAKKAPVKAKAPLARWVEPVGDVCPTSHPVKAKLASKIFHLPGMLNYARTRPDRCYQDAIAAESDGLRPAKR